MNSNLYNIDLNSYDDIIFDNDTEEVVRHTPLLVYDKQEGFFSPQVQLSWRVIKSGTYNRFGLRIPVNTKWNLDLLESLLHGYEDIEVVEWLRFGWPVDRSHEQPDPILRVTNHRSAIENADIIDKYIEKEIGLGAMFGPFLAIPWSSRVGINPLQTRLKRNSLTKRRVIQNLSWPPSGGSVNEGIPVGTYLGQPMKLKYPSVDTLADRIASIDELILIYGFDMNRAYRQLNLDPSDYPLMGMYWKGFFFWDCNSPMGLRMAAIFCQRTTNSIRFIHQQNGYWLMNYQDDLNSAEPESTVWELFHSLCRLLDNLNIDLSEDKTIQPTTCAEVLGVWFDTVLKIMAVTPQRIEDTMCTLEQWRFKVFATKRELQSIVGKLQFLAKCVRPGRVFIARLLNQLSEVHDRNGFHIPWEVRADLKWWYKFLPKFNGTSVLRCIDTAVPGVEIMSDSSLKACGGWHNAEYFHCRFPEQIMQDTHHISQRELVTVVLCLRLWGKNIAGKKIYFHCDNQASVKCVNSGKTRDPFMQKCLREITFLAATGSFEIKMSFVSMQDNAIPDALSRWYDGAKYRRIFRRLIRGIKTKQRRILDSHFEWVSHW